MIAGGNTSLRLDAYSHLFGSKIEFAAFVKIMPAATADGHHLSKLKDRCKIKLACNNLIYFFFFGDRIIII
jgi:hypothetical protein